MSGIYKNVSGLRTKLLSVHLNMLSLYHFNYFILVETWLTLDLRICDSDLNIFDCIIYKTDRISNDSTHNKGLWCFDSCSQTFPYTSTSF